jgi:hypothetical protein
MVVSKWRSRRKRSDLTNDQATGHAATIG